MRSATPLWIELVGWNTANGNFGSLNNAGQEGGQAEFNLIFRIQSNSAPPPLQTLQRSLLKKLNKAEFLLR
jgi:hypothetical protein